MNYYYQRGGGTDDTIFRGPMVQRGYGLGANFRRFFRWIVPLVQKHAVPAISSGVIELGKTALNTVGDIAKDTASGRDFKDSASERINTAVDGLKELVEKKLEGRGKKRKKIQKKIQHNSRKRHQKIFGDIFG